MKLLVGTLYAGENEYEECLTAIENQSYPHFDHIKIENLPKRKAHHKLFSYFIENSKRFDLLIKVDADTVLLSDLFFTNVVQKFSQNPSLKVMNVGVADFFTDELIPAGIQIYRNDVKWEFDKDTIFTDIPIMNKDEYLYDKTELAPAAIHCKNPSPIQAFHYGVHRGLKSIQKIHSTSHWKMIGKVRKNFRCTGDRRIGLAVLGAELVYAGRFDREDANYTNPKMQNVFQSYRDMNAKDIKKEINRLRYLHCGFLPSEWRRKAIRFIRGKIEGRWDH